MASKIRVGSVKMPCEKPRIDGTPKCASEVMRISSAPAEMAGSTSGSVILRMTVIWRAPAMRAHSSSVGSMRSRALTTCMKTKGK